MAIPDIQQFCYLSLQVWSLHGERNVQTYLSKVRSCHIKVIHVRYFSVAISCLTWSYNSSLKNEGSD